MRQLVILIIISTSLASCIYGMKHITTETVINALGKNYGDYVSLKVQINKSKNTINTAIKRIEKDLIDSLVWNIAPLEEVLYFTASKFRQRAHKKFEYTEKKISPLIIAASICYRQYFVVLHCFKPNFLEQLDKKIKDLINNMVVGNKTLSQFYIEHAYKN